MAFKTKIISNNVVVPSHVVDAKTNPHVKMASNFSLTVKESLEVKKKFLLVSQNPKLEKKFLFSFSWVMCLIMRHWLSCKFSLTKMN